MLGKLAIGRSLLFDFCSKTLAYVWWARDIYVEGANSQ